MMSELLDWFSDAEGVATYDGLPSHLLAAFQGEVGFRLPSEHSEFLSGSNGLTVHYGYYRLFGIGCHGPVNMVEWNSPDCWRFAWDDRCSPFWCFGETAWGDQYAYQLDDLRQGRPAPVYFLEGVAMTPEIIAESFPDFMHREVVRNAVNPYDRMTPLARQRFGPMSTGFHLVYSPSLLLGGTTTIDNVQVMDAVTAMVFNGDLATQLDNGPPEGRARAVEPYHDEKHRMRLRLLWHPQETQG